MRQSKRQREYMRKYRQRDYVKEKRRKYEREYWQEWPEKYKQKMEDIKKWQRKIKLERKTKAVNLLGGKCSKCNYKKCLAALEFHHQKGEKEYLISYLLNRFKSWGLIEKETKKCILLCSNCHKELHFMETN